ncbi:MAG: glycoside hydrolase family 18 protein [Eubacterium sp.]
MKSVLKKLVAVILCCAAICLLFSSCYYVKRTPEVVENRLEYTCDYKKLNDGNLSNSVKLSQGDYVDIDFGKIVSFDTVSLYEKGDNCNEFRIYIEQNGEWQMVYQQDRIMAYHLCFIGEVSAQKLRLEISDCSKDVKLKELSVYMAEKREEPVKVSQYLRLDVYVFEELINDEGFSGYYDVVTDPILFGEVWIDEKADICFNHSEEFFAKQVSDLKTIIGDRDVRIWCCIFFDQYGEDGSRDHEMTMNFVNSNIDKISESINNFVDKYGLYGVDFDWEYPQDKDQWKAYDLIVERTAEFTKVSVALPPWQIMFSESAKQAIENVNVMAYDLFDVRADHSNAYNAGYEAICKVRDFGFSDEQILLGIPTYGRTTDKSEYAWPTIRDDGQDLGEWGKIVKDYPYTDAATGEQKTCDAYLNSCAEARDKTAVALDENIGGVMIFRAFCDAPYTEEFSLHRGINEAIEERTK